MTKLLTEKEVALMLGCTPAKLQKQRQQGRGLRFSRLGRHIRYRLSDIEEHLEQNTYSSTSEYGGRHA